MLVAQEPIPAGDIIMLEMVENIDAFLNSGPAGDTNCTSKDFKESNPSATEIQFVIGLYQDNAILIDRQSLLEDPMFRFEREGGLRFIGLGCFAPNRAMLEQRNISERHSIPSSAVSGESSLGQLIHKD